MTPRRLSISIPVVLGIAALAVVVLLLPGPREVNTAARRADPPVRPAPPPPAPLASASPAPATPALADAIRRDDAPTLAALTDTTPGAATLQVARDLAAIGRPAIAIAYLALRADGEVPATWRLRVDLLRTLGREHEAQALLADAARNPGTATPADLVWAGYALDRVDLITDALLANNLHYPTRTLTLDLVRRAEAAGRLDRVAAIERVAGPGWRAADPWLALRIARARGDTGAELAAADRLPPADRDAAREAILARAGDRAGLRRVLLARGDAPLASAERLLAAGFRADAIVVLQRAAATLPTDAPAARRLLYLLGPRPEAIDRMWLRTRAGQLDRPDPAGWLHAYAERDAPAAALATVARHPFGDSTDGLLLRMQLARAANDAAARDSALAALLDGRALAPAELRQASALTPAGADRRLVAALARRRIEAGLAGPRDRLDLGWAALDRGDAATAAASGRAQLAATPDDPAALRLVAEAEQRRSGAAAARPWLARLLAQLPPDSRDRAELLDRFGRRREALALVAALRRDAPDDRGLRALEARLLIADGRPGAARTVLAE